MAKNNATQSGVLENETETGVQASHNPRYDFMEQLANNNHEVIQAELAEQGLAEPKSEAAAAPEPAAENTSAPHVLTEDELASYQVRTKIDGQEHLMPAAEALRVYQKDAAASKRLDEVARRNAELDRQEAELRQREEALSAIPNNPTANPSSLDDQANELVSALYEGDEEKTREAVKKLLGERQQAIPQPQLDIDQVADRARQKMQDDVAMKAFIDNYQDVVTDPFLVQMADTHRAQALRDGKPLDEALTYAGDTTREWLKAKGVTVTANDREARKAALDHVPAASQKTSVPETATDSEATASDTIRAMREARGLPV